MATMVLVLLADIQCLVPSQKKQQIGSLAWFTKPKLLDMMLEEQHDCNYAHVPASDLRFPALDFGWCHWVADMVWGSSVLSSKRNMPSSPHYHQEGIDPFFWILMIENLTLLNGYAINKLEALECKVKHLLGDSRHAILWMPPVAWATNLIILWVHFCCSRTLFFGFVGLVLWVLLILLVRFSARFKVGKWGLRVGLVEAVHEVVAVKSKRITL
jgi:hypothetical protein